MAHQWTDALLDEMRSLSDAHADEAVQALILRHAGDDGEDMHTATQHIIEWIFRQMNSNDAVPPQNTFPELMNIFTLLKVPFPDLDLVRIQRAQEKFCEHIYEVALVLLMKSLPEGYAAPGLSDILSISNDLNQHPFKRLLSTMQLVLNVSSTHSFESSGRAIISANKLRLLHAGVRQLVPRYRPAFAEQKIVPVNLEDMLATNVAFSYLVIDGMRRLGVGWTKQEEEDYFYIWQVFSIMMGIHPPGESFSWRYIPDDVDDAAAFYDAYKKRHYVAPEKNPNGLLLMKSNLHMCYLLIPFWLRWMGLGIMPRIYMNELIPQDVRKQIGVDDVTGHKFLKSFCEFLIRMTSTIEEKNKPIFSFASKRIFQSVITYNYNAEVTFTIPTSLGDLHGMVKPVA